jgi:aspartate oxidase
MAAFLEGRCDPVDPDRAAPWTTRRSTGPVVVERAWPDVAKTRDQLQRSMIEGAGVVRSADSLEGAGDSIVAIGAAIGSGTPADRPHGELANLVTAAEGLLRSATVRCETRGAHARSDYPEASDQWRRRIVHTGDGVALLRLPPPSEPSHGQGSVTGLPGR